MASPISWTARACDRSNSTSLRPPALDQGGWTPLHWAAVGGRLPVLVVLLDDPRVNPGERDMVRGEVIEHGG